MEKEKTFNYNRSTSYVYGSDGTRLRMVHSHKKGTVTIKDSVEYLGNLVLRNGNPDQYMFNGGYYSYTTNSLPTENSWGEAHFYIKDYLGSNRMVMSKAGQTEQVNHSYSYGGIIGYIDLHPSYQPYKYEGKELDNTFGLDWYDIHARQYDPVIPSWHAIDPMCEKYYNISPYAFCGNNPIKLVDHTGLFSFDSTMIDNQYYPIIAVFPSNLNDNNGAILNDYIAALDAGMPLMRVDNISDLKSAMGELSLRGISTSTYTINSHGFGGDFIKSASFSIGEELVTEFTDFSSLRTGFEGHSIFIGACDVGNDFGNGYSLITKLARQTKTTVIASDHILYSGYKYDGSYDLNNNAFENGYVLSRNGIGIQKVFNVTMDKHEGIKWSNSNWFYPLIRF